MAVCVCVCNTSITTGASNACNITITARVSKAHNINVYVSNDDYNDAKNLKHFLIHRIILSDIQRL